MKLKKEKKNYDSQRPSYCTNMVPACMILEHKSQKSNYKKIIEKKTDINNLRTASYPNNNCLETIKLHTTKRQKIKLN